MGLAFAGGGAHRLGIRFNVESEVIDCPSTAPLLFLSSSYKIFPAPECRWITGNSVQACDILRCYLPPTLIPSMRSLTIIEWSSRGAIAGQAKGLSGAGEDGWACLLFLVAKLKTSGGGQSNSQETDA